jgi:hypothetical protein
MEGGSIGVDGEAVNRRTGAHLVNGGRSAADKHAAVTVAETYFIVPSDKRKKAVLSFYVTVL